MFSILHLFCAAAVACAVFFCIYGKNPAPKSGISEACLYLSSDRSGNFTGTQTPGTNIYMAGRTVYNCLYALHIGLPRTIGASVGVRHLNTERNTLIAKLALSHPLHLLAGNLDLPHKKSICRQLLYISTTRLEKQAFFHQKFCFFTKKLENKKSASAAGRKGCAKREGLI